METADVTKEDTRVDDSQYAKPLATAASNERVPTDDAQGHSVLAHKYNDRAECPACQGAFTPKRAALISRAIDADDGYISAGGGTACEVAIAAGPTCHALLSALVERHRWTRHGYGRLTCPSCGALASVDDETGRVRRSDQCSPSCPWRMAEEWLECVAGAAIAKAEGK
jgi:hypothetical protein